MVERWNRLRRGALSRRTRIALLAAIGAILGAGVPITLSIVIARDLTLREMNGQLESYASLPVKRAQRAFADAARVLDDMSAYADCTTEHIEAMRRVAMSELFIDEVGYLRGDELACTSWGSVEPGIRRAEIDFVTADGLETSNRILPSVTGARAAIGLHKGAHNVLISQFRLVSLPALDGVTLALAYRTTDGTAYLLSERETAASSLLLRVLDGAPLPYGARTSERGRFIALASSSLPLHGATYRQFILWMLPIGITLAALIITNVIWLSRRQLRFDRQILAALRNGEMHLVYQPIMELHTGTCIGAEALIRWQRPDGHIMRPDLFIPAAEDEGVIGEVTRFVLRRVLDDLGPLLRSTPEAHVAVNLSAQDIASATFSGFLAAELDKAGVAARSVHLEVTERALVDPVSSIATFAALRHAGHRLSIDDFGTGYSSLQYLQDLPVDALKIDKSFVDAIGREMARREVIEHIIDLALSLNLGIIAEGIETPVQAGFLRAHGVGQGQGYLYAPPLALDAFLRFYEAKARHDGKRAAAATLASRPAPRVLV